jgi:hypothetical protein
MAESLRSFPEKLLFCRDYWRRLVRSRLPPDLGAQGAPPSSARLSEAMFTALVGDFFTKVILTLRVPIAIPSIGS